MKRPGWVTVVGVLGIIMGCLGLLGAGQTIMMPRIMEFQRQMFSGIERAIENEQKQSESKGTPPKQGGHPQRGRGTAPADWPPKEFLGLFNKMLAVPDWFNTWLVVSGILRAARLGLLSLCGDCAAPAQTARRYALLFRRRHQHRVFRCQGRGGIVRRFVLGALPGRRRDVRHRGQRCAAHCHGNSGQAGLHRDRAFGDHVRVKLHR